MFINCESCPNSFDCVIVTRQEPTISRRLCYAHAMAFIMTQQAVPVSAPPVAAPRREDALLGKRNRFEWSHSVNGKGIPCIMLEIETDDSSKYRARVIKDSAGDYTWSVDKHIDMYMRRADGIARDEEEGKDKAESCILDLIDGQGFNSKLWFPVDDSNNRYNNNRYKRMEKFTGYCLSALIIDGPHYISWRVSESYDGSVSWQEVQHDNSDTLEDAKKKANSVMKYRRELYELQNDVALGVR